MENIYYTKAFIIFLVINKFDIFLNLNVIFIQINQFVLTRKNLKYSNYTRQMIL